MKRKINLQWFLSVIFLMMTATAITFSACKKEEENPPTADPVASFQFTVSETNYMEVTFTNFSQNATSYMWDFGDGETSTEKDPVHVYTSTGTFTVKLTAKNDANVSADFSNPVTITDPNEAYKLLTGEVSKTWKLFREGVCMSLGESPENPANWWPGLENDGARPCLYQQEFTFHFDGTYEFNDNGSFWGEYGVWSGDLLETCFDAVPANMINADGINVSDWLSGTYSFTYDPAAATATLTGQGAWIGNCKLTTTGETTVPVASTTFNIEITQEEGYDIMNINFNYGDAGYWPVVYVHYYDTSLEPELVTVEPPYGEDLPDLTPTEMWNTFETSSSFVVLDTAGVYPGTAPATNGMAFNMAVVDPAGGATNVGQYDRIGTYQELQFQMSNDIQFDNFTTVSIDVYMPSSNDYSGTLTKDIAIVIGEASQTEQWWTGHIQYDAAATVMDEWVTYTFNLDSPTSGAGSYTPFERTDLDFFAISLGGGGHDAAGTFYIRNFTFN